MSNIIHVFTETGHKFKFTQETSNGEVYNTLKVSEEVTLFTDLEQSEELFEEMDTKLHQESETHQYMKDRIEELENKIFDLEDALEEAQECDNHNNFDVDFDGESDFYQAK